MSNENSYQHEEHIRYYSEHQSSTLTVVSFLRLVSPLTAPYFFLKRSRQENPSLILWPNGYPRRRAVIRVAHTDVLS